MRLHSKKDIHIYCICDSNMPDVFLLGIEFPNRGAISPYHLTGSTPKPCVFLCAYLSGLIQMHPDVCAYDMFINAFLCVNIYLD